jgi:tetratricopeptide (TPR) repeat protein
MNLDVARAVAYFEEALALVPPDDPARLDVATKLCYAQLVDARASDALATGEQALAAWRERGDPVLVGALLSLFSTVIFQLGRADEGGRLAEEAVLLLERQPPSAPLALAYSRLAGREMFRDRSESSIELCGKALALAAQIDVPDLTLNHTLQMLGSARLSAGDLDGLTNLVDARDRALEQGLTTVGIAYVNLAYARWWLDGPRAGIETYREGIELAQRRGLRSNVRWARAELLWPLYDLGEWDEALAEVDSLFVDRETTQASQIPAMTLPVAAKILAHRGELDRAAALVEDFLPRARAIGISQVVGLALPAAAFVAFARGDRPGATSVLREFAHSSEGRRTQRATYLPESVRVAVAVGARDIPVEHLGKQCSAQ